MNRPLLALCALLTCAALAQGSSPLKLTLAQDLVTITQKDGKTSEAVTPMPSTVRPGDLLVETVTAVNGGAGVLRNAGVTLPVPRGTVYQGNATAATARWTTTFSIDGGKTFAPAPLMERVTVTENGKSVTKDVVVSPSRYTHVRWTVAQLNKDESLKFSFRVQVK
ncbi:hypothetical protein [Deinococcus pimensis]|uniref:hypothetical protein n=1 Tax=Deinococcus pimensis TaxID=309888 RepID=UPI0004897243|nr:hypothetical protein [Deinococcus pimensis]